MIKRSFRQKSKFLSYFNLWDAFQEPAVRFERLKELLKKQESDDIFFVGAVANLGAIALENASLYEACQKDYENFRRDMLEWRAALGQEWLAEKSVVPPEEE